MESEHLANEPNDRAGSSLMHLDHAHALRGKARQALVFRIIDHPPGLRARQPVQGVVRTDNEGGASRSRWVSPRGATGAFIGGMTALGANRGKDFPA